MALPQNHLETPLVASIGSERVARISLQFGLAFMAVVSLNPYFMWGYQKLYYALATSIVVVSWLGCFRSLTLTRARLVLVVAFSLFLIYLSFLTKVHGGTTRWFLLIPFTIALLTVEREDLQKAFEMFYWAFALALVPAMLVWVWVAAGFPLEFRWMIPPAEIVQRSGVAYIERFGMLFVHGNAMILPSGGMMFRLCGMLDEPGTVGTVAALCLAVTRFRLWDIRGAIAFIAGMMSFSVAFAVLSIVGLIATLIIARRPWLFGMALISGAVIAIPMSGLTFDSGEPHQTTLLTNITVINPSGPGADDVPLPTVQPYALFANMRLRSSVEFDNRALNDLQALFSKYARAPAKTLLFGIASDASSVYAGESSAWLSVLINYGIVGFAWLFILFFTPLAYLWYSGRLDMSAMIFCLLFLMSFYQRPVIWLPAQMLIYFAGLQYFELRRDRPIR